MLGLLLTLLYCCREEVLATLGAVSDFSFSWGLMDRYTTALQAQVDGQSCSDRIVHVGHTSGSAHLGGLQFPRCNCCSSPPAPSTAT